MSKKKWRLGIVLDFHNNRIKRRSTLDSILKRMNWNHTNIGLTEAERPEPIARAIEPAHMHIHGSASGRIRWEPADVTIDPLEAPVEEVIDMITGHCPRCGLPLRFAVNRAYPVMDFNCHNCGRHMTYQNRI